MKLRTLFINMPPALLLLGVVSANAGETIDEAGDLACAIDRWDESEPTKGHKLVDNTSRCIAIPNDPAAPKVVEDCVGSYEFMPDESWKGSGRCTDTYPGGDKKFITWEEGSHLKEYRYTVTGGTGKYNGASGGGTYVYENLTDTLSAGTYKGKVQLP